MRFTLGILSPPSGHRGRHHAGDGVSAGGLVASVLGPITERDELGALEGFAPGGPAELGMISGVVTMRLEQFEELVASALDGIPAEFGTAMENVAVLVDDLSPPGRLLGLYEGVPLTERGAHYSATSPDRITVYMAAICARCESSYEVVELVRRTVIHEVAHHFGIGDERLRELGWG